ncbi:MULTISPECIES: Holliday junction resolvase RuvX [Gordonia]|uniref:Putative pre-16S rRNA nuclease n=2 Tax=Gordonia TaxID=2053 RepID=L7LEK0_9ACTN|nr:MULTISPECIES: Holliday junction resolvase RuvX [Gordonia]AUH69114.1 Holliday junction resolvase RuvX [Gordonia sp. YC-JH1]KJR06415.1 Holliday junction resolvase [Gordonia sihwensis]KXT56903.1 Holliday junction resolvase [Gordonia sp. QH-12]MBY4568676.1 Holliday junction resolvase RuvX [Gordonia sihwensis]WFN94605.1 Holliday junction resolvase RuvX [Gordonia sihwensis]
MISPRGRRIAIDVGSVRVGVAVCDPDGILATPVETVRRAKDGSDVARIVEIIAEYEAIGVVIGLPRTLRGEEGPAVRAARYFGRQLAAEADGVAIEFYDERLTTVTATAALRASGVKAKDARAVVDQAAAVAILQGWLDAQR